MLTYCLRCLADLLQELGRREEIIAKKEAMLAEKSELEIKKLRSSQVINKVSKPSFLSFLDLVVVVSV